MIDKRCKISNIQNNVYEYILLVLGIQKPTLNGRLKTKWMKRLENEFTIKLICLIQAQKV